jgi:L-2,4-diaminobutyrate decarboxylase
LFDAIGAVTNQVMAIYEMGPFSTAVEHALVDAVGQRVGWKAGEFAGLITHGGSLANLTGLLTARNVSFNDSWENGVPNDAVLVAQADSHYSVTRSAGILGIGAKNVVPIGLDAQRRMDPDQLDSTLTDLRSRGVPIVAVCAAACATPIGAFDPLRQIAEVCQKHEVWLHVDAAHGGAAIFSNRHRHLLDGLDLADSVVIDAHKMMFVPGLCAFVFYKNAEHRFRTFAQDAPYLFDPTKPGLAEFDQGAKTVECTKRAAGFGLWGLWSMFGPQLFGDLVDITFATARRWYEMLVEAPDFEPLHEPQCNIVTYRHLPQQLLGASDAEIGDFQMKLRRRVIESGEFYLVSTMLNGIGALRNVVINPLTNESDLSALLECLRKPGTEL